jgi:hypothetical protein
MLLIFVNRDNKHHSITRSTMLVCGYRAKHTHTQNQAADPYWFRLDLTVAACFRLVDKPADAGGLTSRFLAEARRTQWKPNKTKLSLQKTHVTSALSAPLRE